MGEPKPPEQIGPFRVLRRLGAGPTGTVYLAHDGQHDRPVAVKVLHGRDEGVRAHLRRQAQAIATLGNPHFCPVHDVEEIDGHTVVNMAYVEGRPLSELLRRRTLPVRQAVRLLQKVAGALACAHAFHLCHHNLKPSNVLVTVRGDPVLTDFGAGRCGADPDTPLTGDSTFPAAPAYLAPEQVAGPTEAVGPAADVYSFGAILYEVLTGRPPFEGGPGEVLAQILMQPPEPPSAHRAGIDPRLEAICLKAMARRPGDRFGTLEELAGALAAVQTMEGRVRRGRLWLVAVVITVVALAAGLAAILVQRLNE